MYFAHVASHYEKEDPRFCKINHIDTIEIYSMGRQYVLRLNGGRQEKTE